MEIIFTLLLGASALLGFLVRGPLFNAGNSQESFGNSSTNSSAIEPSLIPNLNRAPDNINEWQSDQPQSPNDGSSVDNSGRNSSSWSSQWQTDEFEIQNSSSSVNYSIENSSSSTPEDSLDIAGISSPEPEVYCDGENDERISIMDVSRSERLFSLDLYKEIIKDGPANLAISSANTFFSLAETFYGASEETKEELKVVLQLPAPYCYDPLRAYEISMNKIAILNSPDVSLAHGMYVSPRLEVSSAFRRIVTSSFRSNVKHLSNRGSPAKWFTKHGNPYGMLLSRFVSAENIDGAESIILLGGSYIKGTWLNKFHRCEESLKIDGGPTYGASESASMQSVDKFNYGMLPEVEASFIEIPLMQDDDRSHGRIFIILPNEAHGIHKLEQGINEQMISQQIFNGSMETVNVTLPEFIIEHHLDLVPTLRKMNLNRMFNDEANFSNITDSGPAKVDLVLHKIVLHGRATKVAKSCTSNSPMDTPDNKIIQFKGDHPFLIVVAIDDENPIIVSIARFAVANDNF